MDKELLSEWGHGHFLVPFRCFALHTVSVIPLHYGTSTAVCAMDCAMEFLAYSNIPS